MRRFIPVLLALTLIAAAYGGSSSDSAAGVASLADTDTTIGIDTNVDDTETVDAEEALFAFAQCLRDNGVDVEDPTVDANGNLRIGGLRGAPDDPNFDRETVVAARDACSELLSGIAQGFDRGDRTEIEDTLLQYAACMRENGFEDMPDPDFSNLQPGQGGPFDIDRDDPAFQAANEVCQGQFGGGRGPGGGRGFGPGGSNGGNGGNNGGDA